MAEASIPTALMTNASTTEKEKVEIPIINVPQLDNLYSVSHPFFTCGATIQYLRQTKTMFVMRGLPGSGKSTLVSILKQLYPQSLAVCSADHFFINEQGVYVFNRDLIGQAHNECQKKAEEACRNAVLTVIIDNTNIRLDECRPYFEKANRYGYLILVVEPRTSWKLDATILAERNSHQVPKDVIESRLRQYHPLIPFFFGLFLNEEQSNLILDCAQQFYRQALHTIPALRKDLELMSRGKSISVDQYLNRTNMKSAGRFLHCTMKFIGRVTDQSRKEFNEYAGNRAVAHAIGKMFRALVVGFIITPRTMAARLLLPERQSWVLWAQDDNEPFSEGLAGQQSNASARPRPGARRNPPPPPPTTTTDQLNPGDDYETAMAKSLADDDLLLVDKLANLALESESPTSFLRPTFGFLSRAHLTCAVAPGVSAAQAGIDMVEMIRRETNALTDNRSFVESEDDRVVIRYFDAGHAMVYLREPLKIQTVFAGSFH